MITYAIKRFMEIISVNNNRTTILRHGKFKELLLSEVATSITNLDNKISYTVEHALRNTYFVGKCPLFSIETLCVIALISF